MKTISGATREKLNAADASERINAVSVLSRMNTEPEAIGLLCRTLHDPDASIRQKAAQALIPAFSQAYTIVFRNCSVGITQRDLNVPVFETLLLPRKIVIEPATCDMRQVEAFAAFTMPGFSSELLAKFSIFIEGNPSAFAAPMYRIFQKCKTVDITIDTVKFGQSSPEDRQTPTLWLNPDVRQFQLPLRRLRHIEIDAASANPMEIERFLTYSLENMGQDFLRLYVVASVHDPRTTLSRHILNNLLNICKNFHNI